MTTSTVFASHVKHCSVKKINDYIFLKKYLHVPVHKIADKNSENIVECISEWKYESFKHVSTVSAKRLFPMDKIRIIEIELPRSKILEQHKVDSLQNLVSV